jgi:hypothetical protein
MDSPQIRLRQGARSRLRALVAQFGWELRLMIDGGILQRSQVCRSNEEVLDIQELWKAAMVGKGWG